MWIESPDMMNNAVLKGPLGDPGTVELHPVYELCPIYVPAKVPHDSGGMGLSGQSYSLQLLHLTPF